MPRDSLLTAKTYLWVSSLGKQMINKYLSELMLGLKGILHHTPLLTRLISTRCCYGTSHSFYKGKIFAKCIRNSNSDKTQVMRKKRKKKFLSKFEDVSQLFLFGNALPTWHHSSFLLDQLLPDGRLTRSLHWGNNASDPDGAGIWYVSTVDETNSCMYYFVSPTFTALNVQQQT